MDRSTSRQSRALCAARSRRSRHAAGGPVAAEFLEARRLLSGSSPTAVDDAASTLEDNPVSFNVLVNDTDPENDALSMVLGTHPSNGSVTVAADGSVTYTPTSDFNGTDSFGYYAFDGTTQSALATVTLTVTAVNDAPSFFVGGDVSTPEDAGPQSGAAFLTSISPGPADEAGQAVTFEVSNDNNALFLAQPAIAADGTLTYTPAANANGSATVTIVSRDDGGTADGGIDASAAQTFTLTVRPVNDAPSFTAGAGVTTLEDAALQTVAGFATALSAGPADEAAQVVSFTAATDNVALFDVLPAVAADGTLTFRPAADANGSATVTVRMYDDGGIADGGVDASTTQAFTVTVTAVNDAPSVTIGTNQSVAEDAGEQTIDGFIVSVSAGPANEAGQSIKYELTSDNSSLFSTQPFADAGVLRFVPAPNANGTATVTLFARDNGGTANGGVNVSSTHTFQISVRPVNDPPSFSVFAGTAVLEDAPAQELTGFAHDISAGPADEAGQAVWFGVTVDTPAMFLVQPYVDTAGTLTFTPYANAVGIATITIHASDDGGTAESGVDTSATQTFEISLDPVNDVPVFTAGGEQVADEDAGVQTVAGFATSILAGPSDESWQSLTFVVSADNPALFSEQPAIAADGTLTYRAGDNLNGSATVSVYLHDDGGTAAGGDDTTDVQTFTITVRPVNDAPSFGTSHNPSVAEDAGTISIASFASPLSAGPADEAGQALSFTVSNDNPALFATQPVVSPAGTLSFRPAANAHGVATVTLRVADDGGTERGGNDTSADRTFTISVTPVNDPPVAQAETYQVVENTSVAGNVLTNDSDIESADLEAVLVSGPAHGQLTLDSATGAFTYAPSWRYEGSDQFVYRAGDGAATSADVTVFITVLPGPNALPVSADDAATVAPGRSVVLNVLGNDADADGDALAVSIVGGPVHGTAAVNPDGTITYAAGATTADADEFIYQVSDGNGGLATATARIVIEGTGMAADPTRPGEMALVVKGNGSHDFIKLGRLRDGRVRVLINGVEQGRFETGASSRIIVAGGAGNDALILRGLRTGVAFFGGDGDDVLIGSAFNDVLVGGSGNDLLVGGAGRDLLLGGAGADTIRGGGGDDLIVAGTTDYDADTPANRAALSDLLAAWSGPGEAAARAAAVWAGVGASGARLIGRVHDDGVIDTLAGGGGIDSFVALAEGTAPDVLLGRSIREGSTTLWL